ncbi:MAG: LysM domain [Planctomycetaceae bacterium]|nr:LysM domain [Planctomycetaceae bacterium]
MVTDHRQQLRFGKPRSWATRSGSGPRVRNIGQAFALLAALMLCQAGCRSVVDPGRSMNGGPPPQAPLIVSPPASGPQLPAPPATNQSGVIRQPAASVIKLPQAAAGESKYHTVVSGDNWTSIAQKYHMTVQELTDANGIDPATKLQPGQLVYIPEK